MTERLAIAHDLPDELADALGDDVRTAGTLYNELQELSAEAFAARFEGALATLRAAVDGVDTPLAVAVVGLAVDVGEGPLIADAAVVSVHVPRGDGGVDRLLYAADATDATDTFLMVPVRPEDCPPGSGQPASALSVSEFRDVVSAMAYKRFDLLNEDLDGYRDSYLRPVVRGLEAYAG